MSNFIKIVSSQKIEVQRELAFVDRTPDLTKQGSVVVGSGDLIRVNTLKPISFKFEKGVNNVPDPFVFKDPVTREDVSESILSWPGVKHLIDAGVFEAFDMSKKLESTDAEKPEKGRKTKSLDAISESSN